MSSTLPRELGLPAAVLLGLGSILGTGVFVSLALATQGAGAAVLVAIALAALLATANGLSSAQLAACHPVSGGTYEYGYRELTPALGFTAGWMFLCAKCASAATAALGFAGYVLAIAAPGSARLQVPLALLIVVTITLLVLTGMRRSSTANAVMVVLTLAALGFFVIAGLPAAVRGEGFVAEQPWRWDGLAHATALVFVAYTGYGRIATLGEEVLEPRRTIPRAVIITLLATMAIYLSVAAVAIAAVGAGAFGGSVQGQAAPLSLVARAFSGGAGATILAAGAVTAMAGVLLNLVLGLSRVVLAMGRRGDLPAIFGRLDAAGRAPRWATIAVAAAIAGLVLIGSVRVTWTFSAFAVLIYYAITNGAALRLGRDRRLFPPWVAWCGLLSCLVLAFQVQIEIWATGVALLAAGLLWHVGRRGSRRAAEQQRAGDE